jgi:hypothetical protein
MDWSHTPKAARGVKHKSQANHFIVTAVSATMLRTKEHTKHFHKEMMMA